MDDTSTKSKYIKAWTIRNTKLGANSRSALYIADTNEQRIWTTQHSKS